MSQPLTIVVVYPDLLGTYGDGGNGLVLAKRAAWRGLAVDLLQAPSDRPLPRGDLYCLGGGEDGPQVRAAQGLGDDGTLAEAVGSGASVLAVCAGYQIVGNAFPGADGRAVEGLGLLDLETFKHSGTRFVGEVLADVFPFPDGQSLPRLTGFENHGGATRLGTQAHPLARTAAGAGNGWGDGTEGARSGRVIGTYLHGPVLARNPALADLLLQWATGSEGPLDPLDDREVEALRHQRLHTGVFSRPEPEGSGHHRPL